MPKRVLQGTVVSDKSNATIVVKVVRLYRIPVIGKITRQSKKYHAHDPNETAKIGDVVSIRECRPVSKLKKWEFVSVVRSSQNAAVT